MTVATAAVSDQTAFWRNIAATFSSKILAAGVGLLGTVIIARSLGPDGRGAFAAAIALTAIGIQIGNLGLHASNTFAVSKDKAALGPVIANSLWLAATWGVLLAVMIAAFAWATGMTHTMGGPVVLFAAASVPIGLGYTLLINLLIAVDKVSRFNQIETGLKLAIVVLTAFVWLLNWADPMSFLIIALLAQAVALATILICLTPAASAPIRPSPSIFLQHAPFAIRSYIVGLLGAFVLKSDMILVQQLSGNEQAGHYSIAVAMADALYMLPVAVGTILFPKLTSAKSNSERRAATIKMVWQLGSAMLALAILAAALSSTAVGILFGKSFLPAAGMFNILAIAICIMAVTTILSIYMAAEGMPWIIIPAWVTALVVNIALNLAMIPTWGATAAAVNSVIAYAVLCALHVWQFARMRPSGVD